MSEEKPKEEEQEDDSIGIEIPLAGAAGVLFGIGAIFLEQATGTTGTFNIFAGGEWTTLLGTPAFWGVIIANAIGLVVWFWALSEGRVAVVGPFMSGFMVMIPVIVAIVYFGESLNPLKLKGQLKLIGIITITAGGMILSGRE